MCPFQGANHLIEFDLDCFGITAIVLITLNKWFDELGTNELDRVAQQRYLPRPVGCTTPGFHPDEIGRQLRDRRSQLAPGHALRHYHLSSFIDSVELEYLFC